MTHIDRWPARHPLCTCPEINIADLSPIDRPQCRGGTITHPPPLDADQCKQLIAAFIAQHAEDSAP
jgi:hypothetical protein